MELWGESSPGFIKGRKLGSGTTVLYLKGVYRWGTVRFLLVVPCKAGGDRGTSLIDALTVILSKYFNVKYLKIKCLLIIIFKKYRMLVVL